MVRVRLVDVTPVQIGSFQIGTSYISTSQISLISMKWSASQPINLIQVKVSSPVVHWFCAHNFFVSYHVIERTNGYKLFEDVN